MNDFEAIHWHEGLFLQPHHLQYMQRHLLHRMQEQRRFHMAYPYGLVHARRSSDALAEHVLRFERLHAVMPSGLEVRVPENADLPDLNVKQAMASASGSLVVHLAVPRFTANGANTIEAPDAEPAAIKRPYAVREVADVPDENTGENAQPLLVRRINARLLLDHEDRSGLETIALLRLLPGTGENIGQPRPDRHFAGPCLLLSGSPTLRELASELANQVKANRDELVQKLVRNGLNIDAMQGPQVAEVMRLRTLNRFAGRLPLLVQAPHVTPLNVYLELRDLLGELAALHADRDPFEAAPYDHDAPAESLRQLVGRIQPLLMRERQPLTHVPFQREQGRLIARLEEGHLSRASQFLLCVRTRDEPRKLANLVEDRNRFKLMAASRADEMIFGIRLKEERDPPVELPASSDRHYFRLLWHDDPSSEQMWQQAREDLALALWWHELEESDYEIALFMTLPAAEG